MKLNEIKSVDELLASISYLEQEKRMYSSHLSKESLITIDETIADLRLVLREFLKISAKLLIEQICTNNESVTKKQIEKIAEKEQLCLPAETKNELPAVLNVSKEDLKKQIGPLLLKGQRNEALSITIKWMSDNKIDTSSKGNCWKFLNQLIADVEKENKSEYSEQDLLKLYKFLEEGDRRSAIELFAPLIRESEPELSGKRVRLKMMEIYNKIKENDDYRYELLMLNKELGR